MIVARSFAPAVAVVIATLLAVPAARAQSSGGNANVAEALFRDGVTLFDRGRVAEACDKFAESFRLDPANGTLLNAALCHEKLGKTASAWAEFAQLAGRAAQASQKDREALARARAAELETKLSKVSLAFGPSANVEDVRVDGQALGHAAWTTPLPLDPGTHVFVFGAPGKKAETRTIVLAAGPVVNRVDVPMLEDVPDHARDHAHDHAPVAAIDREPDAPGDTGSARRTIAFVTGGAGIVALGIGTYFGLETLAKKRDVDAHCTGRFCDAQGLAADDAAHAAATASTIAFGVGVAGVAVGAFLLLTSKSDEASAARVRVAPQVGMRGGSLDLTGCF